MTQGEQFKPTIEFLSGIFGPSTEQPIFLCSLPNERDASDQVGERRIMSRDPADVASFVARWDKPGRGLFFCVATLVENAQPERPKGSMRHKRSVAEIALFHADVDEKSIAVPIEDVFKVLRELPCPPSVVVRSGHGLHCYWLLKESIQADDLSIERTERINALLADVVGGDPVSDVCRLMRLPGSHNTKHGEWISVEVALGGYERRYEVDDIEDMLDVLSPRISRRDAPRRTAPTRHDNPFLAVAAKLGFKPSIEVEQRLAAMTYQGVDETSVHETQVVVTAALLGQGKPVEEIVDIVIEATRVAAGDYGARWNWARERRTIHGQCESWLRKHPELKVQPRQQHEAEEPAETVAHSHGGGSVVALSDHRKSGKGSKKAKTDVPKHVILGQGVIEAIRARGDDILVTLGEVWHYTGGLWSAPTYVGKQWLEVEIEIGCRTLNIDSTNRIISETRQWILRNPDINHGLIEWDRHGLIPTRSGLLDPKTKISVAPLPEHRATWRIECIFDPSADCQWWKRSLEDLFADRTPELRMQTIETLQELLGVALIENRSKALSKAMVLYGGGDSGKTTVLEVFSGLLSENPISTALDSVSGTHGLMDFVRRAPWVLHEAFDQSRWLFSSIVKSLLTGDPVPINIKNGPLITKRFQCPVFWGTNHPPQFKEATKAIVNRMIVVQCRQEFKDTLPVGAALEAKSRGFGEVSEMILTDEKSGLLNWALEGLHRAIIRGFFSLTTEIIETRAEIRADSNLVAGFVNECISFNPDAMISTSDFCAAFTMWWHENKGENRGAPSNESVGKAITSLGDARIASHRETDTRYYLGVHLNGVGQDFWQGVKNSTLAQGKASRISSGVEAVNRSIPTKWDGKDVVSRMRAEFEKRVEKPPDPPPNAYDSSYDSSYDSAVDMTVATVISGETQF